MAVTFEQHRTRTDLDREDDAPSGRDLVDDREGLLQ
jgi:hypothetical protein